MFEKKSLKIKYKFSRQTVFLTQKGTVLSSFPAPYMSHATCYEDFSVNPTRVVVPEMKIRSFVPFCPRDGRRARAQIPLRAEYISLSLLLRLLQQWTVVVESALPGSCTIITVPHPLLGLNYGLKHERRLSTSDNVLFTRISRVNRLYELRDRYNERLNGMLSCFSLSYVCIINS